MKHVITLKLTDEELAVFNKMYAKFVKDSLGTQDQPPSRQDFIKSKMEIVK